MGLLGAYRRVHQVETTTVSIGLKGGKTKHVNLVSESERENVVFFEEHWNHKILNKA